MDSKYLYNYKRTGIECCGGILPKTTGVAGLCCSAYRGGIISGPEISTAGFIFDLMFKKAKTWSAYKMSDNSVYVEFIDGTMFFVTDSAYRYAKGSDYHQRYYASAQVIHDLVKGDNTELINIFNDICTEYGSAGCVTSEQMYKFCDSFYFGHKELYGFNKDDEELDTGNQEEIKAGFRSGVFERLNSLFPDMMGRSIYDTPVTAKKRKTSAKKEEADFLKECKDGKYRVSYEWPEQLKGFIKSPSYLDSFETTPEFEEIVKKIKFRADRILERMDMGLTGAEAIGKDALNILLLGKPGTGKTALAYALSAATGMPVCTTAWNKHSEEGEVEGKSRIVDGKPSFVETDALLFHQFGGIDINEEINLADPSVTMGCLGQKLEYPFIVKKNGFETVVRHPLNVIIGT